MLDKEKYVPVVEPTADKVHRALRAVLGLLPYGSGTAVEILNSIIQPPIEARNNQWIIDVVDAINDLYEKRIVTEVSLLGNEEFITILLQASQLAIKNHQREKLKCLSNAVTNTLIKADISTDKKLSFLSTIDQLTVTHINILKLLQQGIIWHVMPSHTSFSNTEKIAMTIYSQLGFETSDLHFIEQAINDLSSRVFFFDVKLSQKEEGKEIVTSGFSPTGAVVMGGLKIPVEKLKDDEDNYQSRLTHLGIEFIEFISEYEDQ